MYVYAVKTPTYLKIGRWSGGIKALEARYRTCIPDFELIVFQFVDAVAGEKQAHVVCWPHHLSGEMFELYVWDDFLSFCSKFGLSYCTSTDLQDKCAAITKKKYVALQKDHQKALDRIGKLEEKSNTLQKALEAATKPKPRPLPTLSDHMCGVFDLAPANPTPVLTTRSQVGSEDPFDRFVRERMRRERNGRIHVHRLSEVYVAWLSEVLKMDDAKCSTVAMVRLCQAKGFILGGNEKLRRCCPSQLRVLLHWVLA